MTHSSKNASFVLVASLVAGSLYACGGDEPAKGPVEAASAVATQAPAAPTATAVAMTTTPAPTATVAAPPPAPEPPALAIEGVKVAGKTKQGKPIAIEVKPDGVLMLNGKPTGAFAKHEFKDDKGATLFSVAADGKVSTLSMPPSGAWSFNDKDELQADGKPLANIADDGTPSLTMGAKTEKLPFKFERLPAKSKRAALLVTMYLWLTPTTVTVTTTPATTPATTPPKSVTKPTPKGV